MNPFKSIPIIKPFHMCVSVYIRAVSLLAAGGPHFYPMVTSDDDTCTVEATGSCIQGTSVKQISISPNWSGPVTGRTAHLLFASAQIKQRNYGREAVRNGSPEHKPMTQDLILATRSEPPVEP